MHVGALAPVKSYPFQDSRELPFATAARQRTELAALLDSMCINYIRIYRYRHITGAEA
jgi:hypothetical protein